MSIQANDKSLCGQLNDYFESHFDEILSDLNEIVSINSAYDEKTAADGKPFGEGSAAALAWAMKKGKALGLDVKNFDNYAISMTYGQKPVLGILSHLDTVPAGEGWNYNPFAATLDEGVIYGRGTIDDKGPSVAVLWAVKALEELNVPLEKGFRLIMGGNEENGCNDIAYYEKCEPFPEMVFTPDGSFPVLNCEKGLLHLTFESSFDDEFISKVHGGTVINAIPDKCIAMGTEMTDVYEGKSAHGSRPENGENAITKFLDEYCGENLLLINLARLFPHGEFNGKSLGLGFSDEISGMMTAALTLLDIEDGRLVGGIDIRFPIDKTLSQITEIVTDSLMNAGFSVKSSEGMEPHYVPSDSEFVKTLLQVYELVKGEKGEAIAEGGVTYVHNTPGGVAFGAEFPWENNNMHGADEHISVETFMLNLNMYANAIARLCKKD